MAKRKGKSTKAKFTPNKRTKIIANVKPVTGMDAEAEYYRHLMHELFFARDKFDICYMTCKDNLKNYAALKPNHIMELFILFADNDSDSSFEMIRFVWSHPYPGSSMCERPFEAVASSDRLDLFAVMCSEPSLVRDYWNTKASLKCSNWIKRKPREDHHVLTAIDNADQCHRECQLAAVGAVSTIVPCFESDILNFVLLGYL